MKKIEIVLPVFGCDGSGNRFVQLESGLHDVSPETERQVLLGNGREVDVEEANASEAESAEAVVIEPGANEAPVIEPEPQAATGKKSKG